MESSAGAKGVSKSLKNLLRIASVLVMIGYGGTARAELVATVSVKTKPLPKERTQYIYTINNELSSTVEVDGVSFTANQGENLQEESIPDGWIGHGHNVDQPGEQMIYDAPEFKQRLKPGEKATFVFSSDNSKISLRYLIIGNELNNRVTINGKI